MMWYVAQVVVAVTVLCVSPQRVAGLKNEGTNRQRRSDDPHGGVKMGEINSVCDDAQHNIEVDWDPSSSTEYMCDEGVTLQPPLHVCLPNQIHYPDNEIPPTSGAHRPLWPDYGEYKYLPPQRWIHNLEHGAVVFLYHPCADQSDVEKMREVATSCLRKHIITPYKLLPPETPFAAVTWGCKLLMSHVQTSILRRFVKDHALQSPEGNVASKGQYTVELTTPARIVSDYHDSKICPGDEAVEETDDTVPQNVMELVSGNGNVPTYLATGAGTATGTGQDQPPSRPRNPYVVQSQQRRRRLSDEAARLHENVQRLIRAYKRLVETK
ncbi:hypothetical protein BaRGS_00025318 [Batillaria attramentaria]|uniref:DUF3105 domain-containing protein n=1 Tax=Batillaria attramentaria TaxID=370345 RepID=A0ABD0K8J3_9CAEN